MAVDLTHLTAEQAVELAKHMVSPIRCGGTEYIEGKLHLRLGGWLVPATVTSQGWPAIRIYQNTHAREN